MKLQAHAKINLSLNVIGKLENGYHELDMIMLPITLCDEVEITIAEEDSFTTDDEALVMDDTNTVVKAVELMRATYAIKEHFYVHVKKRIPAQAGLAGGSADGAAVLRGINELCHLNITKTELAALGKQIGADVPFCVLEQSARVKGIGEILIPFEFDWTPHVLLIKPQAGVSTKAAFEKLDFTQCPHPDAGIVQELLIKKAYTQLPAAIANSLEYSAFPMVPKIAELKQELLRFGFSCVLMSGSGSTVFAISEEAKRVQRAMEYYRKDPTLFVCDTTFYHS